jgi:hypothetical protein
MGLRVVNRDLNRLVVFSQKVSFLRRTNTSSLKSEPVALDLSLYMVVKSGLEILEKLITTDNIDVFFVVEQVRNLYTAFRAELLLCQIHTTCVKVWANDILNQIFSV